MTDVQIGAMETTIEFEPEVITASAPSTASPTAANGADVARLRELLRPIIVDLLEDELSMYSRTRG